MPARLMPPAAGAAAAGAGAIDVSGAGSGVPLIAARAASATSGSIPSERNAVYSLIPPVDAGGVTSTFIGWPAPPIVTMAGLSCGWMPSASSSLGSASTPSGTP